MRGLIEQADRLLAMLSVSGDSVMLLAEARKLLGEIYRMAPEDRPGEADGAPARAQRSGREPNRSPAKRVRSGKEEERGGRISGDSRMEQSGASSDAERRSTGMSELWPQAEAKDMEAATT